jgi:hypothetical protein
VGNKGELMEMKVMKRKGTKAIADATCWAWKLQAHSVVQVNMEHGL